MKTTQAFQSVANLDPISTFLKDTETVKPRLSNASLLVEEKRAVQPAALTGTSHVNTSSSWRNMWQ